MAQSNPYPLRVDRSIMDKFKEVAAANGRSTNKEIEMLMKDAVSRFEAVHGAIQLPSQEEDT
ncbi:MAG: Arc family DNA-binding protein [Clostridia bacterium]